MALPQEFLLQLHDRNDIVDLVSSYLEIKRRGRIHTGLCPFHNEKTPSFVVYPETQSFYCFGCGTGGDAITFVKLRENLEYIEAVRLLAARAGMAMPEDVDESAIKARKRMLEANKLAARFFFDTLNSDEGKHARGYLRARGLEDATIIKFGVGYAPQAWDKLKNYLNEMKFSNSELIEAGLCSVNQAGSSTYDFFRDRVIFPVIDIRGNVVAFSGRALGDDPRKYINTRDTAVFKKSRMLYGMNIAKSTDTRRIIVAEGQMDVIAIHQAGFDNAVAALGTALTDEHARIVAQYADEVLLCYDGDDAGQRATRRAIGTFKNTKLLVKVIEIEDAKDPDEYIKKNGADKFRELLDKSGNSTEYELGRAKLGHDVATDSGKVQYLAECAAILARVVSPTERDLYAGRVAGSVDVAKSALLLQIEQNRKRLYNSQAKDRDRQLVRGMSDRFGQAGRDATKLGAAASERRLVALLFFNPDLCDGIRAQIEPGDFISDETSAIYSNLVEAIQNERFSGIASLSQQLTQQQLSVLSGMLADANGINFTSEDADFLIEKILKPQSVPSADDIKSMDADEIKQKIEKNTKGC